MCLSDCESSYLGTVVGRVSNGIAGARFVVNGIVYNVSDVTNGWNKVLFHLFGVCVC